MSQELEPPKNNNILVMLLTSKNILIVSFDNHQQTKQMFMVDVCLFFIQFTRALLKIFISRNKQL